MMRKEVLRSFRALHKTIQITFKDDIEAITESKRRVREEFKKNKHVEDPEKIKELIKVSEDVEKLIRTTVIQAKLNEAGHYEMQLQDKPTVFQENNPYKKT